ncbi:DHX57 [Symbiodinium natans]|uniref:DHX57 protein n=1 Tax=Symbiodinium natans TaxID=878477 RepID=A0A812NX33_9DINO|nr:DHX57 [Symbiodinium natans]
MAAATCERSRDSLAGSIQVSNDAREIRYWIREEGATEVSGARPPRLRAFLHPSSLLFKENSYACPYVMYSDKMVQQQSNPRHPTKLVLTGCSEASVYALLLFGGDLQVNHKEAEVAVDGWADFAGGSTTVVAMIQRLRAAIDALLLRKVQDPSEVLSGDPVAQCVVTLLTTDGLG